MPQGRGLDEGEEITAGSLRHWLAQYGSSFDRRPLAEMLSMETWAKRLRDSAAEGTRP